MKRPNTANRSLRSAIRIMAAFVVAIAQIGIAGASVLDAREGASAASHFEAGGTSLHFAHNEADCFMCRAQHLGDATPFQPAPLHTSGEHSTVVASRSEQFVDIGQRSSNSSRAPPSSV